MNTSFVSNQNTLLGFAQSVFCARLNKAERGVCILLKLMLLNSLFVMSGANIEDALNLETALTESLIYDPLLNSYSEFFSDTSLASQILWSLCCIFFLFVPLKRTGLFLHKHAFAFRPNLVDSQVQRAHGCRAPPSFSGCL